MEYLFQRLLVFCSLMVLLTTSIYAEDMSSRDAQNSTGMQASIRVDELLDCLAGALSSSREGDAHIYLKRLETDIVLTEEGCVRSRNRDYHAGDFASYAMGVSLQRKLLSHHEGFNWVDFINGLLRAKSGSVDVSNFAIDTQNRLTLLDDAEASQQYLESVADREDVVDVDGVFIKRLLPPANGSDGNLTDEARGPLDKSISGGMYASSWYQAFNNEGVCNGSRPTEFSQRLVKFYLVKPINQVIEREDVASKDVECIAFEVDDVIRGWRLLVEELQVGEIYDVLIPSELAYGATGVPGMVEGDENLRFLMQVVEFK